MEAILPNVVVVSMEKSMMVGLILNLFIWKGARREAAWPRRGVAEHTQWSVETPPVSSDELLFEEKVQVIE